jgi:hypothetical protein
MTNHDKKVLRLLYTLAAEDRAADLGIVAGMLGLSCVETDRLLMRLECAGLVDAERVRLTLVGLALAVNISDPRRHARRASVAA